jgi:hypothetical protein
MRSSSPPRRTVPPAAATEAVYVGFVRVLASQTSEVREGSDALFTTPFYQG